MDKEKGRAPKRCHAFGHTTIGINQIYS